MFFHFYSLFKFGFAANNKILVEECRKFWNFLTITLIVRNEKKISFLVQKLVLIVLGNFLNSVL